MNTLHSEWIKLRSTKSFWWTSALIILIPLILHVMTMQLDGETFNSPSMILAILVPIILVIVPIQAAMVFTTEYRYKLQEFTYLATPNRTQVALAKLLLYGVISVILVTASFCISLVGINLAVPSEAYRIPYDNPDNLEFIGTSALGTFFLVTFVQGVAMMLRHTAGVVALMLSWALALEDLLRFIPRIGEYISDWLPFGHLKSYLGHNTFISLDREWSETDNILYFMVFACVFFVLGIILLEKRDA
ncbi:ABC transporter permease [Corynebacterium caspium]|uniref:ABC transporter permease n=1 Tax=Corynebacterium caspium TaxID=234828 RepID=UPI00037BD023|nr:ABC transporter permease [Corynebacterium caspium]WKD58666.1 ABC-2 family transporter protein [Corynebacterium caspium DSM 44850]